MKGHLTAFYYHFFKIKDMAKQQAKRKQPARKPDSVTTRKAAFEQEVKKVLEEESKDIQVDEFVQDAIVASVVEDDQMAMLITDVQTSMAGGYRPEYVTSDGNCFEKRGFAWAVDHIRNTGLKLYQVKYDDQAGTFKLKLME